MTPGVPRPLGTLGRQPGARTFPGAGG